MFGLASPSALALALGFAACAVATPTLYPRTATQLTSSQLAAFAPYTQLARAAYCQPTKLTNWNCGGPSLFPLPYVFSLQHGD